MADERRIVIELKATSSASSTGGADKEAQDEALTSVLKVIQHPVQSLEKNFFGKNIIAYQMWQYTKKTIKSAALYQAEKYFNLSEDYKSEQTLENIVSVVENVAGIGASILGGAVVGAKAGGVWGAVIGAAVGTVQAGVNTFINREKAFFNQNMKLTTMNIQSSFQQTKLGLVDNGRGTLN